MLQDKLLTDLMGSAPSEGIEDKEVERRWKFFNGMDGVPFRTQNQTAPMFKGTDPAHKQPKMTTDMHVDIFDLSDKKQLIQMQEVLDACAKGKGYVSEMDKQYEEKIGSWRVLLVWGEFFLEDPLEVAGDEQARDRKVFR